MRLRYLILALCVLAAGCASDPGRGIGRKEAGRYNVFISPAGEPFRARPGEPYPMDVWFNGADANHDGAVTEAEFVADAVRFFHRLDANHDGVIDGFELETYEQTIAPEILPRVARLTARDIPPLPKPHEPGAAEAKDGAQQDDEARLQPRALPHGAAAYSLINEPEPVAAEDANFDGRVTLAEAEAAARRRFKVLDRNHDGRLTLQELPKPPAARIAARAAPKGR